MIVLMHAGRIFGTLGTPQESNQTLIEAVLAGFALDHPQIKRRFSGEHFLPVAESIAGGDDRLKKIRKILNDLQFAA
jgi:hypothetical protein